ncbi:MAG: helix-turn-helix domain-containing protein [Comamonadaceae bacterium]
MSEPTVIDSEPTAPPVPAVQLTSGALLRRAREAQGLHIGALAVALKVPVKKLEALEGDRFDLLPDTVFVRGLASSVCRVLKIEPEPILAKLPHTTTPQLKDSGAGMNVPFRSSGIGSLRQFWDQLSKPLVVTVAALLAGALLLVIFPFARQPEVVAGTKAVTPDGNLQPPAMVSSASVPEAAPSVISAAASSGSSAGTEQVAGSGATSGIVVFKAQALAWVEVVDAGGVVQVRRNMVAGETVGVSGTLPLSVVVGRSDTTQVQVRGQAFDLLSIARDNVARFEVN